jgi:peptidase E
VFSLDGSKIYYLQAESDRLQNIVELDIASQTTKVIATDIHENDQVGVSGSQTLALLPE